ncbi:hypothetical protein [Pseudoalteromonas sp. bablab_jr011]|uniref:hypothetical protein n=1 Tax=Pseudoalteromonas sp. bablab_jr011 TaxID=2755062 RepID=UPI0018F7A1FC|nr:hypothetical protein [Pseudoalteromonas sp. bablab_jr011]
MMRILIFILALMSAFFTFDLLANTTLPDDYKSPKFDVQWHANAQMKTHTGSASGDGELEAKNSACNIAASAYLPSIYNKNTESSRTSYISSSCECSITSNSCNVRVSFSRSTKYFNGNELVWSDPETINSYSSDKAQASAEQIESYSCPPNNAPLYTDSFPTPDTEAGFVCIQPIKDCPAGYHSRAVSLQLGSNECLPKQCPPAGSGENLSSTPMTGGVPFDGGGMYCNDGCAFTVNASQISSSKYAVGTSQGAACGDKPYDNKKLADEGEEGNCTTATNGDVTLLSCPDANPTTPEPDPDPHNNDDSKVNEDDTPEKPKETCAEGDTSCNLKNVETEIENSINRQIDNDNELHNKKIDADTKNAKAFLNVMDSIDTAILLQTSQDERLHAVTVGKFNELIDAVNGIETGGGGGGGNGTGNGNIGGQDCEGTIEECAGIGSGDGVELPHETKNLEQYAQKYQNWLPDAELPQEKCITLTTGYTACFSFHYIIYFLQALSGLIVLSSLIHSAAIIVRSV